MMWLAAMRIRAACDHVLHANSTLVDRVDLATPLSLSSQRLPAPRLLLPRSGLSRSDFVPWPDSDLQRCLLLRRSSGISGQDEFTPMGVAPNFASIFVTNVCYAFCSVQVARCLRP